MAISNFVEVHTVSIPPPAALHARIFQDRLRFNVALTRAHVPQGIELMAVIKNDAYGHGLIHGPGP